MEDILISSSDLRKLLKSAANLGFAQGGRPVGERKMFSVKAGIDATVTGLIKTNSVKR